MAGSVNKVILIGNLGADPEVRHTQDGRAICNLRLATTDSWRDKQTGERREKTEWHNVVIFNEQLGKIAQQYLKKGSKVYVEGQLQTRKWQDNSGQDRYTTEVVIQPYSGQLTMLDTRGSGASGFSDSGSGGFDTASAGSLREPGGRPYEGRMRDNAAPRSVSHDLDDDVPF